MSIYLPRQFASQEPDLCLSLMREQPFACLVSHTPDAPEPFLSQLPIVLPQQLAAAAEGTALGQGTVLLGHLARPNPHSKILTAQQASHQLLFTGPDAYLSPKVYPDEERVPTWTYLSVLAKGRMETIEDAEGLDHLLKQLIAQHEPDYADQWRGLTLEYQEKMLNYWFSFPCERVTS
jgi:transcriptional regulator